jgi:hypothetical protein
MSTKQHLNPTALPVDPYPWQTLLVSLFVLVATWAALIAWLFGGSDGAGNVYAAWTWFVAVIITISAVAEPKRLSRGAPVLVRYFFRFCALAQVAVLAWFGCWALFAACLWCVIVSAAWRRRMDERIAVQGARASV